MQYAVWCGKWRVSAVAMRLLGSPDAKYGLVDFSATSGLASYISQRVKSTVPILDQLTVSDAVVDPCR
jgi:hypothetical protein